MKLVPMRDHHHYPTAPSVGASEPIEYGRLCSTASCICGLFLDFNSGEKFYPGERSKPWIGHGRLQTTPSWMGNFGSHVLGRAAEFRSEQFTPCTAPWKSRYQHVNFDITFSDCSRLFEIKSAFSRLSSVNISLNGMTCFKTSDTSRHRCGRRLVMSKWLTSYSVAIV